MIGGQKGNSEPGSDRRFPFGANWQRFIATLTPERVAIAEQSLSAMLGTPSLEGRSFLDIGSGSGLFSLAARRLGARVHSFDYDPQSVECTAELKRRFFPHDDGWTVEQGSVLDAAYIQSLGVHDVVYSWGVLHHTGAMWQALGNAAIPVGPAGLLYVAIYNDQDALSRAWAVVKRTYCSGLAGRTVVKGAFYPYFAIRGVLVGLLKGNDPLSEFRHYRRRRGMSARHDWVDWLGGYPFEVAKPEQVFEFYDERGFSLRKLRTTRRLGCNEFVFRRVTPTL